jgi:hypothetical protein
MDSPLQIETSMSGTKAKVICSFVVILIGSPRLPPLAAGRRSIVRKITEKLRSNFRVKDANAACDPCYLAVAQDGNLR